MLPELFCFTCDEYRKDYRIMYPIERRNCNTLNQYDVVMCMYCLEEIKFHKHLTEKEMELLGINMECEV